MKKRCTKLKKLIDRGKKSKTLSEVKPVENIKKNLQSFLEISLVQKEVLLSHKLGDHAYEYQNPFEQEQECQESLIQRKIHKQQNLNEGLKYS